VPHVHVRSFFKGPFDLVEPEIAVSSARSEAKLKLVEDFHKKMKSDFEGITGSLLTQGTLRSNCFISNAGLEWKLRFGFMFQWD